MRADSRNGSKRRGFCDCAGRAMPRSLSSVPPGSCPAPGHGCHPTLPHRERRFVQAQLASCLHLLRERLFISLAQPFAVLIVRPPPGPDQGTKSRSDGAPRTPRSIGRYERPCSSGNCSPIMGPMGDGPAEADRGTAPGTDVAPLSADSRRAALLDIVEIREDECILLLATKDMGRLAVVLGGKPQIFPVNYAIDERTVIFRTAPGTKLMASTLGDIAFEVDAFDAVSLQGWAVEVRGLGRERHEWARRGHRFACEVSNSCHGWREPRITGSPSSIPYSRADASSLEWNRRRCRSSAPPLILSESRDR